MYSISEIGILHLYGHLDKSRQVSAVKPGGGVGRKNGRDLPSYGGTLDEDRPDFQAAFSKALEQLEKSEKKS